MKNSSQSPSFSVVTTFSHEGYHRYGKQMLKNFDRYWPPDIQLHVYHEGDVPDIDSQRIFYHDIKRECPDLTKFVIRNKNNPRDTSKYSSVLSPISELQKYKDWYERQPENSGRPLQIRKKKDELATLPVRYAGVKFSYKSYVQYYAGKNTKTDYLIWMDADTKIKRPVPSSLLTTLCPANSLVSFLGRKRTGYTETGWVAFNRKHPYFDLFIEAIKSTYDSGELYSLDAYHDCWVFDVVRERFEKEYGVRTFNISRFYGAEESNHPMLKTPLSKYIDHFKGIEAKRKGASEKHHMIEVRRSIRRIKTVLSSARRHLLQIMRGHQTD